MRPHASRDKLVSLDPFNVLQTADVLLDIVAPPRGIEPRFPG